MNGEEIKEGEGASNNFSLACPSLEDSEGKESFSADLSFLTWKEVKTWHCSHWACEVMERAQ